MNKLNNLVTGDETWVYFYDPKLKTQSAERSKKGAPPPKKFKRERSAGKVMVAVFFSRREIIALIELEKGLMVTSKWYTEVCLPEIFSGIHRGHPNTELRRWFLHHVSPYKSQLTSDFLADSQNNIVEHAPYSPDLTPCDFYLFPKITKNVRGRRFETRNDVLKAVREELDKLEKRDFEECFDAWLRRLKKCIEVGGNYVEVE